MENLNTTDATVTSSAQADTQNPANTPQPDTQTLQSPSEEWAKIEYEKAIEIFKTVIDIRRKDLFYITALQIAILTLIKDSILRISNIDLNGFSILLAVIGFLAAVMGLNNERRLSALNDATQERAKLNEHNYHTDIFGAYDKKTKAMKIVIRNRYSFVIYYGLLLLGWVMLFLKNYKII